jgi:hypothetical protein
LEGENKMLLESLSLRPPGEKSSDIEKSTYWKSVLDLASALYHSSHRKSYIQQVYQAKEELVKLSGMLDDNFLDPLSSIVTVDPLQRSEKYRRDSIISGIKRALDTFKEFPDIHRFLSDTIVIKQTGQWKPFTYVPERYTARVVRNVVWITSV